MNKTIFFKSKSFIEYTIKVFIIFYILLISFSCSKPNYCECEEVSGQAIKASVGLPSDVDFNKLEDCGDKVSEDINLNMPGDKISIDFIQQVSYEMCKYGYYQGKGYNGNKYYPKSEK